MIRELEEMDWDELFDGNSVEESYLLKSILSRLIDIYIPTGMGAQLPVWMSAPLELWHGKDLQLGPTTKS